MKSTYPIEQRHDLSVAANRQPDWGTTYADDSITYTVHICVLKNLDGEKERCYIVNLGAVDESVSDRGSGSTGTTF